MWKKITKQYHKLSFRTAVLFFTFRFSFINFLNFFFDSTEHDNSWQKKNKKIKVLTRFELMLFGNLTKSIKTESDNRATL